MALRYFRVAQRGAVDTVIEPVTTRCTHASVRDGVLRELHEARCDPRACGEYGEMQEGHCTGIDIATASLHCAHGQSCVLQ